MTRTRLASARPAVGSPIVDEPLTPVARPRDGGEGRAAALPASRGPTVAFPVRRVAADGRFWSRGAACRRASTRRKTPEARIRGSGLVPRGPAVSPDVAARENRPEDLFKRQGRVRRDTVEDRPRPQPRAPSVAASAFDVGGARRARARSTRGKTQEARCRVVAMRSLAASPDLAAHETTRARGHGR
ncbi:MAG: hypothetical protein LAQ69_07130 [Acidobacteriia bacterium]|nr:hypothetical protein [Terriglobia bacterium]